MQITNWLQHTTDPHLQQAAHEKIAAIRAIEKDIPGVIIIHNLAAGSIVYLSERGQKILNVTLEEIRVPHEAYHQLYFNPEDAPDYVPKILAMLERNDDDEIVTYFQQVRATSNDPWTWYSTSCKIFLRDGEGRPLLAIAIAIPIDSQHYITPKIERLVEENKFLREKQQVFTALSKREKQVLRLAALGLHSYEIAARLHISETTAKTHRRNIRNKLKADSHYDLMQFAQAFNLI